MKGYLLCFLLILFLTSSSFGETCNTCEECNAIAQKSDVIISLNNDINSSKNCITIAGNNVNLDCNGHKISSPNGSAIFINSSAGAISIKDCVFEGEDGSGILNSGQYSSSLSIKNNEFNYSNIFRNIALELLASAKVDISDNKFNSASKNDFIKLSGPWSVSNVKIEKNDFGLGGCGELLAKVSLKSGNLVYQIPTIKVSGKEVKCTETTRLEPSLSYTFYTKNNIASAKLSDTTGIGIANEKLDFKLGEKKIQKVSGSGGSTEFLVDNVLIKQMSPESSVSFGGNSYFAPKTVKVQFSDEDSKGLCRMIAGNANGKIDIVFVPVDILDTAELEKTLKSDYIDVEGDSTGLLGTTAFSKISDKLKFSIYDGNSSYTIKDLSGDRIPDFTKKLASEGCRATVVVFVTSSSTRSGYDRGTHSILLSTSYADGSRTFTHEFGHVFGLADEYVEASKGSSPRFNCVASLEKAKKYWGKLVGQGNGDFQVGYFTGNSELKKFEGLKGFNGLDYDSSYGCAYVKENIRPTKNSIMNHATIITASDWKNGFGAANEFLINLVANYLIQKI